MTTEQKLIRKKLSLLELGEFLNNISQACRINGCSRQHFYDIKRVYEEQGLDGLKEKTRRKPCIKNRVSPEIEEAVLEMAFEYPAYGQVRVSNELRKRGVLVSSGGVRSIWLRNNLATIKMRLKSLEERSAKEGIVYTEEQVRALEVFKKERDTSPDVIETEHPGYLISQDTFYVGYIKGVGRIYQQTVVDTYSRVAFAKLYTGKVPITAADVLNDRVLPFFEDKNVPIMRVLTDRGTEYCGRPDKHPYEVFLQFHDISHTKTRARRPQSNGICEAFHKTILNEFYRVNFRKKIYKEVDELQRDLDEWIRFYNNVRTHQGKRCDGRCPMVTFDQSMDLVKQKIIDGKSNEVDDTCQLVS